MVSSLPPLLSLPQASILPLEISAMLAANRIRILATEPTRLQSSAPEVIRQINPTGFLEGIPLDLGPLSLVTIGFSFSFAVWMSASKIFRYSEMTVD